MRNNLSDYVSSLRICLPGGYVSAQMSQKRNTDGLEPGNRKRTLSPLQEIRIMQRVLYRDVMAEGTTPAVRAQCARAYDCLEERRNVLRMRPAPKPVDVTTYKKSKPAAQSIAPAV